MGSVELDSKIFTWQPQTFDWKKNNFWRGSGGTFPLLASNPSFCLLIIKTQTQEDKDDALITRMHDPGARSEPEIIQNRRTWNIVLSKPTPNIPAVKIDLLTFYFCPHVEDTIEHLVSKKRRQSGKVVIQTAKRWQWQLNSRSQTPCPSHLHATNGYDIILFDATRNAW